MALLCCQACECVAGSLSQACSKCCSLFGGCSDVPSPFYTIFAVVTNVAVGVVAAIGLANFPGASLTNNKYSVWLIVTSVFAIINIAFAIYLYARIYRMVKGGESFSQSAWRLLAYDPGVYIYIWVFLTMLGWIIVGLVWANNNSTSQYIVACVALLIVYVVVGVPIMLCTLVTECCKSPRWHRRSALGDPIAVRPVYVAGPRPAMYAQPPVYAAAPNAGYACAPAPQVYGGVPAAPYPHQQPTSDAQGVVQQHAAPQGLLGKLSAFTR